MLTLLSSLPDSHAQKRSGVEIENLWCYLGEGVKHENLVSNELIRVQLPPYEVHKSEYSSEGREHDQVV